MALPYVVLGIVLLLFGRELFWVTVAIAGFLVAIRFASVMLADQPQWLILCVALGAGVLGALLAILAQRVAFALAGFYGGSLLALMGAQSLGAGENTVIFFVIGGVVGAVFAALIMDWAIVVLTCLVGAGAIVEPLGLGPLLTSVTFLALVVIGASFQAKRFSRPE